MKQEAAFVLLIGFIGIVFILFVPMLYTGDLTKMTIIQVSGALMYMWAFIRSFKL